MRLAPIGSDVRVLAFQLVELFGQDSEVWLCWGNYVTTGWLLVFRLLLLQICSLYFLLVVCDERSQLFLLLCSVFAAMLPCHDNDLLYFP